MKNIIKISFIFLFTLCIIPKIVFANEIRLETQKVKVHIGEEFVINVLVNTSDSLNAIEGKLLFDSSVISIKDIIDGNSVINFWVERPHVESESVIFSGATPVGFIGTSEKLFSIIFVAKKEGEINISINNASAYLNDGTGKKIELIPIETKIIIDPNVAIHREIILDVEPPEDFTPVIISDKNINGGKNTLIFTTQDKGIGISNYYIKEGRFGFYRKASSPYLIKDQNLNHDMYIKVKDKNSNERVVIVLAKNPPSLWKQIEPFAVTVIVVVSLCLIYLLWKKSKKGRLI